MSSPNWRPNWLEKWGYRVPPLELTERSDRELIPARVEILLHEGVEKTLQDAKSMTEETKQKIKAIMVEAQTKVGFAPDSPKLTLVIKREILRNFVKRIFAQ